MGGSCNSLATEEDRPMAVDVDPIRPLLDALAAGEDVRSRIVAELARQVTEAVAHLPGAWFDPHDGGGVEELAQRLYRVCDTTPIARSPFVGRTAFRAFRLDLVDGETFRRHVFSGRRSLLRDLLRSERAARLAEQPGFARRIDLYLAVGERLRPLARKIPGTPARWALPRPAPVLAEGPLVARLREQRAGAAVEVDVLLEDALRLGGPRTQAGLTRVASAVLGADLPGVPAPDAQEAARRRAALELAEDEDAAEVQAPPIVSELVIYRHAEWAVEVRRGVATQLYGPSALTLRIQGRHLPLVRGVPTRLPAEDLGPALDAVDVRGRRLHLERD